MSLNNTDKDKLESFMQAYKVYKNLIKGNYYFEYFTNALLR